MFREIPVRVHVDQDVLFTFGEPLSIISVTVASPEREEIMWDLISDRFKPVDYIEAFMIQGWPADEAPPEVEQMLAAVAKREEERISREGPEMPPLQRLRYGEVPPGYREDKPAKALAPGRYTMLVFGEQGNARALFDVPAA